MAGRPTGSDRTRSYKTTASTSRKAGATRSFSNVSSSQAKTRLAREKQRRQYEQQKREKIIFALFVVIILVMILFAILIFKKIIGDAPKNTVDTTETTQADSPNTGLFTGEMVEGDKVTRGSLVYVTDKESKLDPAEVLDLKTVANPQYVTGIDGSKLELTAGNAFVKMAADCNIATGYTLNVQTAYEVGDKGEFSTGLLLDISLSIDGKTYRISDYSEVFDWLKTNAPKYGFSMREPERTHYCFRYVGVPHASYMSDNSLSLAGYLELLRTSYEVADGAGSTLPIKGDGGVRYEIYYVKSAGGDMVEVPILNGATFYEISGDNMGGFIVTVRIG